jgi:hypothetical protein
MHTEKRPRRTGTEKAATYKPMREVSKKPNMPTP